MVLALLVVRAEDEAKGTTPAIGYLQVLVVGKRHQFVADSGLVIAGIGAVVLIVNHGVVLPILIAEEAESTVAVRAFLLGIESLVDHESSTTAHLTVDVLHEFKYLHELPDRCAERRILKHHSQVVMLPTDWPVKRTEALVFCVVKSKVLANLLWTNEGTAHLDARLFGHAYQALLHLRGALLEHSVQLGKQDVP